ncbi:MAG: pitrilysin family protein [bacterium]
MKRAVTFCLLAVLLVSSQVLAEEVRTIHMPNGLDVVMMPDASSPLLSSLLVVRTGSSYETLASAGSTHMLEHMMFRGTKNRTQDQIYDSLDKMGAYYNANTSNLATTYILVVPVENAKEAMDIQMDMVLNSTIPADTFEVEKGRVIAEIQQSYNSPSFPAEIAHLYHVFGETSYGFPTLGSITGIKALTAGTVRKFHDDWYAPNNMTLVLRGDLSFAQMEQLAEDIYGGIPARELPTRPSPWPEGLDDWRQGKLQVTYGAKDAGMVQVTFPAPRYDDPDYPAYTVLTSFIDAALNNELMGGGPPIVRYAYSSLTTDPAFSVLDVTAPLMPGADPEQVTQSIIAAVSSLSERDFSDEEVAREIAALQQSELFFGEQVQYGAFLLVPKLAVAPYGFWKAVDKAVAGIDASDIEEAAARWTTSPLYVASAYVPADGSEAEGGITLGPVVQDTLASGLVVIARQVKGAPVAGIHMVARGRSLREGDARRGWVDLLHRLLNEGYGNVDEEALDQTMKTIGMELEVGDDPRIPMDDYRTTPEYSFLRIQVLADRWVDAVDLLGNLLTSGTLDRAAIDKIVGEMKSRTERSGKSLTSKAKSEFMSHLYGDNVIALPVYGDGSSLENIDMNALAEFRTNVFGANNLIISILAPSPAEEIIAQVDKAMKQLPHSLEPVPVSPGPTSTTGEATVMGEGRQGYLATGFLLKDVDPVDKAALYVANGMISDRIYRDLGEKKGWAYGAGSSVLFRDGWGSWTSSEGLPEEHLQESLDAIYNHVEEIAKGQFDQHNLDVAKGDLRGKVLRRYSSRINLAMGLGVDDALTGDPMATWELYDQVQKVSLSDVKRVAKKYLYRPKNVVTVFGKPDPNAKSQSRMPMGMMGGMGH